MKTDILASFPAMMANVREKEPCAGNHQLRSQSTNCANIILAAGASPTMAHEVEEVGRSGFCGTGSCDEYGHHGGRGSHAGGRESR